MKNCVLIVMATLTPLALMSCGDTSGDGGVRSGSIDPNDPNAVSGAISIQGATRVTGSPPAPGGGTGTAATITPGSALTVTSGDTAELEVGFTSESGYENCYVQVSGADDYFLINEPNPTTSGTITIEITIGAEIDTGDFDFYTCIAGANGGVSNAITTPVGVTYPGGGTVGTGGGGDVICSDYGVACPTGGSLRFCANTGATTCYFEVGASRFNCGDCTNQAGVTNCAQQTILACAGQ